MKENSTITQEEKLELIDIQTQQKITILKENVVKIKKYNKKYDSSNIIFSIPHSSTLVDVRCFQFRKYSNNILLDTDMHTNIVYDLQLGTIIEGMCNPYMINYSRSRESVNDKRGVFAWEFLDSSSILKQHYPFELQEELLTLYYDSYHEVLEEEIQNQIEKGGFALVIDCHSMAKIPMRGCVATDDTQRPDICIGTLEGGSIDLNIARRLKDFFENHGYDTTIDTPYKGGYITQKYSQMKNVYVIQIELSKELYCYNFFEDNFKLKGEELQQLQNVLREGLVLTYKDVFKCREF
ncbi:MAG: N-formylglutamate amidohydrolase [Candidatus Woesearchaeota archaeon]